MKEVNAPQCEREDDLVVFLYGELSEAESRIFRSHLHSCATCSDELRSFQTVRESVVTWRNESLGGLSSPALLAGSTAEKPSALAAWRQFFNLAPLWMKGSVAFASILFCLLAGLAIARWQTGSSDFKEITPVAVGYSQEQLDALVAQRVTQELERIKQSEKKDVVLPVNLINVGTSSRRNLVGRNPEVALNTKARRPLSKTERDQLAADLRLIASRNESELEVPDDGINQ